MTIERWVIALAVGGVVALVWTPLAARRSRVSRHPGIGTTGGIAVGIVACVPLLGGADAALVLGIVGALWLFAEGTFLDSGIIPERLRELPLLSAAIAVVAAGLTIRLAGFDIGDGVVTVIIVCAAASAWRSTPTRDGQLLGWSIAGAMGAGALGGFGGQIALSVLAAAIVGASLGFLAWWLPPIAARLRVGGAKLLGFLTVVVVVDARPALGTPRDALIPLIFLAVPLLDTILVTTARVHGRRLDPVNAGLSGRLRALGLPPSATTLLLVGFGFANSAVALFAGRNVLPLGVALAVCVADVVLLTVACLSARVDGAPGRWSRRVLLAGVAGVGIVVVLSTPAAIALLRARTAADQGAAATRDGLAAAHRGDNVAAVAAFTKAENRFLDARKFLTDPFAAGGLVIPVLSPNLHAARELTTIGIDLAHTGKRLATTADPQQLKIRNGTVNLAELAQLEPQIESTANQLADSSDRLDAVDRTFLIGPVDDAITTLQRRLHKAVRESRLAADATRILPAVFGGNDKPRRYFLAVQNNAEARATGGFIGQWGIITALNGKLDLNHFHSVGMLNPQTRAVVRTLVAPAEYKARYGKFQPERTWQNVAMSPDVPTVGKVAADMLPEAGQGRVDGVVTIDPVGLSRVLELTGPITVPPWPVPITAENVVDVTMRDEYSFFEGNPQGRETFLGDVADATWHAFTGGDLGNPARVLKALGQASHQKHLAVWLRDNEAEQLVHRGRADAAFPHPGADLSMVTTQNGGGNKLDVYLTRKLSYDVHLTPVDDGRTVKVDARVGATLTSSAPASGLPQYVIGPNTANIGPGVNRTFVTVYSPFALDHATLDGAPFGLQSQRELGYVADAGFFDIQPGGTRALSVNLKGQLRLGPSGQYQLHLIRQALAAPDATDVAISVPKGWHLVVGPHLRVTADGRHARYDRQLDGDQLLDVQVEADVGTSVLDRLEAGK